MDRQSRSNVRIGGLTVSVVVYNSDLGALRMSIARLREAVDNAMTNGLLSVDLNIVDNGCDQERFAQIDAALRAVWSHGDAWGYRAIMNNRNLGYGGGHNRVGPHAGSAYRLILNPDVFIDPDALVGALAYMESNPETGLLSPRAVDGEGRRQYLCKTYPALLDLLLRGFAPKWVRHWFGVRLDRYEMRGVTEDVVVPSVPIASGCFMLIRESVWAKVGGFDREFFLYFEDFDLSLRVARVARVAYVPAVRITHLGGQAARKGLRHIVLFAQSASLFYRKHGWRWR